MNTTCGNCKYGQETKAGGQKATAGTVWCGQRSLQMGKSRQMPCHTPVGGKKVHHCADCKRARMQLHSGALPQIGHIWCEKRHMEMPKQRSMDCFE